MTSLNLSNGCAPESSTPLMRNARRAVGADLVARPPCPLSTFVANLCAREVGLELRLASTPAACAHFS